MIAGKVSIVALMQRAVLEMIGVGCSTGGRPFVGPRDG
jgi:hypothetical protein